MRCAYLLLIAACGRFEFDRISAASDSGLDAPPDVSPVGPDDTGCWPHWRDDTISLTPARVDELADGTNHVNPWLARDGLELYFNRDFGGSRQIVRTTRAQVGAAWTMPAALPELDSNTDEGRLTMSGDGTLAVFQSNRGPGQGGADLWLAERATATAPFGVPAQMFLGAVNTGFSELDPELSSDGLTLHFAPNRAPQRIARSRRATRADPFDAPTFLDELGSGVAALGDPTVSPGGLVIVYTSDASGDNDLYYANRESPTDPFRPPRPVPGVNLAPVDEQDAALSQDGCELYFQSNRSTLAEIYVAAP